MKNMKIYGLLLAPLAFAACSDDFLEEKKDLNNASSIVYDDYQGAMGRVNDVYGWSLPTMTNANWQYPCVGLNDDQSKSTEEYSGFGIFVNPQAELTVMSGGTSVPDYFHNQSNNIQQSVWGRIRNINDAIRGIAAGSLSQAEKNEMLGQLYFFRAWCYYQLFKWYGGVPIITEPQDPVESSVTPRSSARAVFEFICSDLDQAAEALTEKTTNGGWDAENWGRVTSGTALALKGRVMVLWASPIFNRANDQTRWENAYEAIKASLPVLTACGYGLYQGDMTNAKGFAEMFAKVQNPEAVFATLYNSISGGDQAKNNNWEHSIRPANSLGSGLEASAMLVDLFPMKDGKRPALCGTYTKLDGSSFTYDADCPFVDRDPRFYRTFAFPGVRWAFNGDPTVKDPNNPYKGSDYELWNYVWYTSLDDQGNPESGNSYGADNLKTNKKGIYVRKRSDDADVNAPLYTYNDGFKLSGAPLMEIRYAEVLLNYAEAACGAGHMDVAVEQLKQIRQRVGYTGDCGLGNIAGDQAACMSAVLYERQIELAYEGKRFDDLRRWMLYDGGAVEVPGAPATWRLTGWGGNTCTWLGFKPLNGQRRENMEFRLADKFGVGTEAADGDPMKRASTELAKKKAEIPTREAELQKAKDSGKQANIDKQQKLYDELMAAIAQLEEEVKNEVQRPAAVDFNAELEPQLETLKAFYHDNFVRKLKKGDARDSDHIDLYISFLPRYYLLGLSQGAQSNAKALPQTIGWEDYNAAGAPGTFDPLAE